jgi:hypothetical protein
LRLMSLMVEESKGSFQLPKPLILANTDFVQTKKVAS